MKFLGWTNEIVNGNGQGDGLINVTIVLEM